MAFDLGSYVSERVRGGAAKVGKYSDPSTYLSDAGMQYLTSYAIGSTLAGGAIGGTAALGRTYAGRQAAKAADTTLPEMPSLLQPLREADTAMARARLRARAGVSGGMGTLGGTLLTGVGGVSPGALTLGKTLLGG